jgi:hypothetical protein
MSAPKITKEERLNLDKLIREMDSVDNTDYIRNARQSGKIATDIHIVEKLKKDTLQWRFDEPERFVELCKQSASFLFTNYTDLFHKLVQDELNIQIMNQFLIHLSLIENGELSQHEGSVLIGRLLKDLYLDSAIRRGNKIDEKYETDKKPLETGKSISWQQYRDNKKKIIDKLSQLL